MPNGVKISCFGFRSVIGMASSFAFPSLRVKTQDIALLPKYL
jgi:hypothetical protein